MDKTVLPKSTALHLINTLNLAEAVYRTMLDVVSDEFKRRQITKINAVQAIILFRLDESELTAGDLKKQGCYRGANSTYNLRKLVDQGYVRCAKSNVDGRCVLISLTEEGREIRRILMEMFARQADIVSTRTETDDESLKQVIATLSQIEHILRRRIRHLY